MKLFTVGTFLNELRGRPITAARISAYTRWYSPTWPHCIEYEIETTSGAAAKRMATQMRLEHELAQAAERKDAPP